ncbi:hypothetical protein SSP24_23810 [Streptomyces spinoverrucosus]|uniref:Secreted protein n=1 Tax=Streptomyces spinoverrucosus TaxID=284043 RepID=A0A4Y3VI68_9ACTN|nr:hypothetical protein SSP24_23810 [Streptomyces spinoverrucosus]GHB59224.1 hypothetical protein GCM10010397_31650 [Streptomyces spinoverrucosus]
MRLLSRVMAAGAAVGLTVMAYTAGAPGDTDAALRTVADEAPGYAVEDFAYPQADKIQQERGIILKRGDGHIVLAECGPAGLLEVWARSQDKICFRVTGNQGYLSLEIPSVYAIKGNDYQTEVNMTVDSEEKTFEVDENAWTPVGESADPEGREHMLVEIVTSK